MVEEINGVSSSNTNLTTGAPAVATSGSATMSFDDFLDMINPLQHIPLISSIYRAVTDESINPISRIAGDTIYGGIFGLASAGLAALGAVGDEVVAANNDGKGISQTLVSALFGDDADKPGDGQDTQLATEVPASSATASMTQVALLQTPAKQSPILEIPDLSVLPASASPLSVAQTPPDTDRAGNTVPLLMSDGNKGLPLDRSKMAYGGVMDTAMMQAAQQNETLALAMAGGTQAMQAQQAIRNSRFAVGTTPTTPTIPLPTQSPGQTAAAIASEAMPAPGAPPGQGPVLTQPALQNLMEQLQAMKGLNHYRNAAQSMPVNGTLLNSAN